MAVLGKALKRAIGLRKTVEKISFRRNRLKVQETTLLKLLRKSRNTAFGVHYGFSDILWSSDPVAKFREQVPVHDYNKIHEKWWHRSLDGEANVCWPGQVNYFALSSGTSGSPSKHIPVTNDMLKAIRRTSIRQIFTLAWYDMPEELFEKGILMVGGSTHLNYNGLYYEGDLSGITAGNIPFWFQHFYKPGPEISKERDWNAKLDEIVRNAKDWDIGIIVGVPAWIQIISEKIIAYYGVNSIHDIWPNLMVYCHGGVSFEPYRKGFEKLMGKPMVYIDTYLASEGYLAIQSRNPNAMQLVLNGGIFFEFVPFNDKNFTTDSELVGDPQTLTIDEVKEGEDYAILLSTCAGAWRYLIGDTIKFVDVEKHEIIITGRTKHYLSLCGEHLSVDNMNKAIRLVSEEMNIDVKEYTVAGIPHDSLFAHKWFIGADVKVDKVQFRQLLDEKLCELNDDYKVERSAALKDVIVEVIPSKVFYDWLDANVKVGAQTKFPRVMKRDKVADWEAFVSERISPST